MQTDRQNQSQTPVFLPQIRRLLRNLVTECELGVGRVADLDGVTETRAGAGAAASARQPYSKC